MTKTDFLSEIKKEVLNLKESPLYKERVESGAFPVIGEGNHDGIVMFVGEAPGAREAATGRPFCGSAGKILDQCLQEILLERGDTYITNILKDRPPRNRDPLPKEIEIYTPFLDRQINIIQPKIIASLGRFSAEYILKKFCLEDKIRPITALHGVPIDAEAKYGAIKILPLLHPAVVVYNRGKKEILMEGFRALKKLQEECKK